LVGFVVSKVDLRPESGTKTFCGESEFMPPEVSAITSHENHDLMRLVTNSSKMLLDKPYHSAVDWWQLGIITYQMLTRQSPFQGDDEDAIYDAILADEPSFPSYVARDSIDFIQKLLNRQPERRLGSGVSGADQVMAHAFFGEINWVDLYHKRVPAPFVPTVASRTDVSNFDSEFTLLDTHAIIDTPEGMSSKTLKWVLTDER